MNEEVIERMLNTLMEGQKSLSSEVKQVREEMRKLIILEERQINQKEAMVRIGNHVDRLDADLAKHKSYVSEKCRRVEDQVTDLRIVSARVVTKITVISAVASAVIATLAAQFLPKVFG